MAFKYVRSPRFTLYPNTAVHFQIGTYVYRVQLEIRVSCTAICIICTAASLLRTDRLYRKKNVPEYCTHIVYGIFSSALGIYIYTHVSGLELSSEAFIYFFFHFDFSFIYDRWPAFKSPRTPV